ncbi:MAG: DEAD/DEAH box helicase, partial [Bacteroidota bacterium]
GKTAAFVLPILQNLALNKGKHKGRPIRSLILVPTRELAQQVDEFVKMYGRFSTIQSTPLYGGVSIENQKRHLRNGVDIVAATPGRLLDHIQQRTANLSLVEILVIDEADRMFDMGFINDVRKIISFIPAHRQTMLFSATMSKEVKGLVASIQKNPKTVEIGEQQQPVASVKQHFFSVPQAKKLDLLHHILQKEQLDCVLVFSRTKHGADRISHRLERSGVKSIALHSDRTQAQRQRALAGFKQGQYQVLVATDIAARGIDVEGISHVINFDTPAFAEDYVHRIGRTGRASALGDAYTFVSGEEKKNLKGIERYIGKHFEVKEYKGFDYTQQPAAPQPRQAEQHSRDERRHSRNEKPQQRKPFHGPARSARPDQNTPPSVHPAGLPAAHPAPHQPAQSSHSTPRDRNESRPQHSSSRPDNRRNDRRNERGSDRRNDRRSGDRNKHESSTPKTEFPTSEKDWQKVVQEIEEHGGLTKKLRRWFKKD